MITVGSPPVVQRSRLQGSRPDGTISEALGVDDAIDGMIGDALDHVPQMSAQDGIVTLTSKVVTWGPEGGLRC